MDERGHHAVRIELKVRRLVLVPARRHDVIDGLLALFLERDARLLGTHRIYTVVELQHVILPDYAASRTRSCGCSRSTGVPLGMIPVGSRMLHLRQWSWRTCGATGHRRQSLRLLAGGRHSKELSRR